MLPTRSLDRSGEGTKYISGGAVEWQKRLALKSPERSQSFLPHARVLGYLGAEPELSNRNRGEKNRLVAGQRCYVRRRQGALFNVNPYAGINQEAHGSRMPFSTAALFGL